VQHKLFLSSYLFEVWVCFCRIVARLGATTLLVVLSSDRLHLAKLQLSRLAQQLRFPAPYDPAHRFDLNSAEGELLRMWHQTYLIGTHGAGFSLLIAVLPIVILLLMLAVFRTHAWQAALSGLATAFAVAVGAYHMPIHAALSAATYGAAFGLFPIFWIVFWAIALFRVTSEDGKFDTIKDSIATLTPDPRLQALLIGFVFAGFLEGAAGSGTPVAIASTMLIGLGFDPFKAAVICLLANTAPVAFGGIGLPIITLAGTTGLPLATLSGAVGALCTPIAMVVPAYLLCTIGGWKSLSGVWTPTIACGLVFSVMQLLTSIWLGPQLTDIVAALATTVALMLVIRVVGKGANEAANATYFRGQAESQSNLPGSHIAMSHSPAAILEAWIPYVLLVGCVLLWNWRPVRTWLEQPSLVFRWPGLHDVVARMPPLVSTPSPYHAVFNLNWMSAAGTACLAATILSSLLRRISPARFMRILGATAHQLRWPTLTVTCVLAMSFLMNYSGATAMLGIAFAATGWMFPFWSTVLGWIGVFLTGSDTTSNALFGSLQVITAERLYLDPVLMAAANSAGGVMGKMISLQTIAITAGATGLNARQQIRLFRFMLFHSIILVLFMGTIVMLCSGILAFVHGPLE
jgi:L-lactate transport